MRSLFVLAGKDLLLRCREPIELFWTFAFPIAIAMFFGSMFGGGGQGAIWRGFSLGEMMLPCAVLLGVGVVCFSTGVGLLRKQQS
jgi:hypothetical protein